MKTTISNTNVIFDNPRTPDPATVLFPDCGDGGKLAPNFPTRTGRVWQTVPVQTGVPGLFPNSTDFPLPACPQPGTYETMPPTAPPILVNKQPASLSSGGIQIPNSSTVVKNPA